MIPNAPSAKDGATIAEIARVPGISRGTVGRAIHQRKGVKDEARAKVLATLDTPAISERLEQAELPFAAVNSDLSSMEKTFYAGPDYRKKGKLHANLLSMLGKASADILIMKGSNSLKGHDNLVGGFVSELAEGWVYEIVGTGDNDGKAEEIVRRRISENTKVDVLFISTAGAHGAIKGLSGKRMLAFANDDTKEVKALVEKGNTAWTAAQEPYRQGYESIKRMHDYFITGDKPVDLITRNIIKIKQNIREV